MSLYTHIVTKRDLKELQEGIMAEYAETSAKKERALHKLNMNTCFGCAHADVCFLSPVTGVFTVRFPQGDANCIAYDLFKQKKLGE